MLYWKYREGLKQKREDKSKIVMDCMPSGQHLPSFLRQWGGGSLNGRVLSKCVIWLDWNLLRLLWDPLRGWFEKKFTEFRQKGKEAIAVIQALEGNTPLWTKKQRNWVGGALHKLVKFSFIDKVMDTPEVSQFAQGDSAGRWQTPGWYPTVWDTVLWVCLGEREFQLSMLHTFLCSSFLEREQILKGFILVILFPLF